MPRQQKSRTINGWTFNATGGGQRPEQSSAASAESKEDLETNAQVDAYILGPTSNHLHVLLVGSWALSGSARQAPGLKTAKTA